MGRVAAIRVHGAIFKTAAAKAGLLRRAGDSHAGIRGVVAVERVQAVLGKGTLDICRAVRETAATVAGFTRTTGDSVAGVIRAAGIVAKVGKRTIHGVCAGRITRAT
jgi:hypothetical protein